jgi:N-acetylmuramoyl-L-alanine amidase
VDRSKTSRHRAPADGIAKHAARDAHHAGSRAVTRAKHRIEPDDRRPAAMAQPLIVIDPGHGGRDSGAVGLSGTLEKTVTLATALDLQSLLLATGKYRVALTRRDDISVPLGQRLAYAGAHAADLFVSIHADSSRDRNAHGASVYVRSAQTGGASPRKVASDGNLEEMAAKSLIESRPRPAAGSPWLQYTMIDNLDDDVHMVAEPARQAHLYVLADDDVPSVLLEMGFLSNRRDESLLKQSVHRATVARAIRDAIDDYFDGAQHPHAGRT